MSSTVLVMADYYLPGFKAGGPIRTLANTLQHLSAEFKFVVVTRDRDLGDDAAYSAGARGDPAGAAVVYLSPDACRRQVASVMRRQDHQLLYLNSLFSSTFSVWPVLLHRLGRGGRAAIVIAPRGELSPGALALKASKKAVFLRAAYATGLYRGVTWQASSEVEAQEIKQWFGQSSEIVVAPDLPASATALLQTRPVKQRGQLRLVFVSRISRKKNLDAALRMIRGKPEIQFDIYGPEEDAEYAAECRMLAQGSNVRFHGPITPEQVPAAFSQAHAFLFPTHGENFGHVVLESMLAGCPPILSDLTPWGGLQALGAGWNFPLSNERAFCSALDGLVDMDDAAYKSLSERAREHGLKFAQDASIVDMTRQLFRRSLMQQPK